MPDLQFPLNRIFILGLTLLVAIGVYLLLYRSAWGLRVRAVTQNRAISGAVGINTRRVDVLTFALGSGLAGIAGCVFTMIGSTNPGTGQLYIVDSFIVVVFGGVYFAIETLALAMTLTVLIIGQQGDTGGANGITDFRTLLGWQANEKTSWTRTAVKPAVSHFLQHYTERPYLFSSNNTQ